jgi:hypothetical protein
LTIVEKIRRTGHSGPVGQRTDQVVVEPGNLASGQVPYQPQQACSAGHDPAAQLLVV